MFNVNGRTGNLLDAAFVLALCASLVGYGRLLQAVDTLETQADSHVTKEMIIEKFIHVEKETKRLADAITTAQLSRVQMEIDLAIISNIMQREYGTATVETK